MKIRTKLWIVMAAMMIVVAVATTVIALTFDRARKVEREHDAAHSVVNELFELSILTHDYAMHPGKRARAQWLSKHVAIAQIFERLDCGELSHQANVDKIRGGHKNIGALFPRLASHEAEGVWKEGKANAQSRETLVTQLLMRSHEMIDAAARLSRQSEDELASTWQRFSWIMIAALIIIAAVVAGVSFRINRSLVRPVSELRRGMEIIGAGNLGFKVGTEATDEIGDLSRAFDRMTKNLGSSIATRERAEERLRHVNAVLRAVRNVNQLIVSEKNRHRLLDGSCKNLIATRGYGAAWIALLDEQRGPVMTSEAGVGEDFAQMRERLSRGDLPECCSKALEASSVVVIRDPATMCPGCPIAKKHCGSLVLAVRIEHEEKSHGVMIVALPQGLSEDEEEMDLLQEVAGDIAFALHGIDVGEEREKSEQTLRAIFESASDGILVADTEACRFVRANKAMCRMLGYSSEEIKGLTVTDIHPAESLDYVRSQFGKQVRGEITLAPDIPVKRKDGTVFPADVSSSPLELDGRPHLLGIFRDMTQAKRAEEEHLALEGQLRQSQKLESIGTLAGGVAHEINNPVMGIMNYSQLILDRLGPDHEVSEFATEIGKETERVATIVKNLLSFARHDKQSHSSAHICDIVEATLSLIRAVMRHDQITLEVDVPKDLPRIKCRSQQIQQVIMNLLTNARDALNEKYPGYDDAKTIIISARAIVDIGFRISESEDKKAEGAAIRNPQSAIRITVEDHGIGIPEDVRQRMFDPFYTTKPRDKGTGLGLAISHGIVKDHGGEITVESKAGEWTRFHVDLPVDNGWSNGSAEGGRKEQ